MIKKEKLLSEDLENLKGCEVDEDWDSAEDCGDCEVDEDYEDLEDFRVDEKALSEIVTSFSEIVTGIVSTEGIGDLVLQLINESFREDVLPPVPDNAENLIAFPTETVSYSDVLFQQKMFTVNDIVNLFQFVITGDGTGNFYDRIWIQKEVIDTIRFSIQKKVISSEDVNIYEKYFGDNENDEINIIALSKVIPLIRFIEQGAILSRKINITAQKYENLISQYDCTSSDIIKLIVHLNKNLNSIIRETKISQDELFNKIISQPEFPKILPSKEENDGKKKGSSEENDEKQVYYSFKLGDGTAGHISATGIRKTVIPALLGSERLYKNKKLQYS